LGFFQLLLLPFNVGIRDTDLFFDFFRFWDTVDRVGVMEVVDIVPFICDFVVVALPPVSSIYDTDVIDI
jgi:hypothetical protein